MSEKTTDTAIELELKELQSLNPQSLQELQEKYGLEVQVRSNSAAINQILTSLGKTGSSVAFARGFDRTTPGYDRYYDRDLPQSPPEDPVINQTMTLAEALKTLSPEQLLELKKAQK